MLFNAQNALVLKKLQETTVFWVNESLTFGKNVIGKGCCFHPKDGQPWLESMGCGTEKAGGIEIYSIHDYMSDRGYWGLGGLLIHELCHSCHNQLIVDGYNNKEIIEVRYVIV